MHTFQYVDFGEGGICRRLGGLGWYESSLGMPEGGGVGMLCSCRFWVWHAVLYFFSFSGIVPENASRDDNLRI